MTWSSQTISSEWSTRLVHRFAACVWDVLVVVWWLSAIVFHCLSYLCLSCLELKQVEWEYVYSIVWAIYVKLFEIEWDYKELKENMLIPLFELLISSCLKLNITTPLFELQIGETMMDVNPTLYVEAWLRMIWLTSWIW